MYKREMFEKFIESVINDIGAYFNTKILNNITDMSKTNQIKHNVEKDLNKNIKKQFEGAVYYNNLDNFLDENNFSRNLIMYCNTINNSDSKTIQTYITFLVNKFTEEYNYDQYTNCIIKDMLSLVEIVFSTINNYSQNETARLVINNLTVKIRELEDKIDKLEREVSALDNKGTIDFDNRETIRSYKSSLLFYYIFEDEYIPRNIYTKGNSDTACSAVDSLLKDKRIILLGDPGSGKTYEALNLLRELCINNAYEDYVPIYFRLIDYGIAYSSIIEYIKKQLFPYFGNVTDDQIETKIKEGKFLIILDGVDEIFQTNIRISFFAEINRLLCETESYYFITSRINPYKGNIKKVTEYYISDITENQIQEVLHNNGINMSFPPQLYVMFANPLFLQIGTKVLKEYPSSKLYNKSQLFTAYFEEICYQRDLTKPIPEQDKKNYHSILMAIGKLAYDYFEKAVFTIDEFDAFFANNRLSYTSNNICDFFRIDIFKVGRDVAFTHRQYQEYFAAYYFVQSFDINENKELYLSLMKNESWNEVMVFAAGLINDEEKQNIFLDMVATSNLKTYISCVKYKCDLSYTWRNLSHEEYSRKYLNSLYNSYNLITNFYFGNIQNRFRPYTHEDLDLSDNQKICLFGCLSDDKITLSFWFAFGNENEDNVQLMSEKEIPIFYINTIRKCDIGNSYFRVRFINLDMEGLTGDSARQVALDIIYENIDELIEKCQLLESDYIFYEKLEEKARKINILNGKSLIEMADWATKTIKNTNNYKDDTKKENHTENVYNEADIKDIMNIANYLVSKGESKESLSLPGPDLPYKNGIICDGYSEERVKERIRSFLINRQLSFHEMVELNFPKMKDYFLLSKDYPYRYVVYLNFAGNNNKLTGPSMTFYRVSVKSGDSIIPEIKISDKPIPEKIEEIFECIMESFSKNGKEVARAEITTTGFSYTLRGKKSGLPLTSAVYDDIRNEFKQLFKKV